MSKAVPWSGEVRTTDGPEGHVHPPAEHLHGDQPLVVVHRDDQVEVPRRGPPVEGVGWVRTRRVPTLRDRRLDSGTYQAVVFVAEDPALAGVGVQAGDPDPGLPACEPPGGVAAQTERTQDGFGFDPVEHVAERHVTGHEDAAERPGAQHHRERRRARAFGHVLRVTRVAVTGRVPRCLRDRRGDDRVRVAGQDLIQRARDVGERRVAVRRVDASRAERIRPGEAHVDHRRVQRDIARRGRPFQHPEVPDDPQRAGLTDPWVGRRDDHHLGPDPTRVAHARDDPREPVRHGVPHVHDHVEPSAREATTSAPRPSTGSTIASASVPARSSSATIAAATPAP